jgi:alpha-tubulin suppressor-like RCC1 family protein
MGSAHMCLATHDGDTWCWGRNTSWQLGNGSNPLGWMVPVPVWAPAP